MKKIIFTLVGIALAILLGNYLMIYYLTNTSDKIISEETITIQDTTTSSKVINDLLVDLYYEILENNGKLDEIITRGSYVYAELADSLSLDEPVNLCSDQYIFDCIAAVVNNHPLPSKNHYISEEDLGWFNEGKYTYIDEDKLFSNIIKDNNVSNINYSYYSDLYLLTDTIYNQLGDNLTVSRNNLISGESPEFDKLIRISHYINPLGDATLLYLSLINASPIGLSLMNLQLYTE